MSTQVLNSAANFRIQNQRAQAGGVRMAKVRKLHMPRNIALATFFGGLTGGFLLIGLNHAQRGTLVSKVECATLCLGGAFLQFMVSWCLASSEVAMYFSPIVGLCMVVGMACGYYADAPHLLGKNETASPHSLWWAAGFGLLAMFANLVCFVTGSFLLAIAAAVGG